MPWSSRPRGPRHRWELARDLPYWSWDPQMQGYEEPVRCGATSWNLARTAPNGVEQAQKQYPLLAAALKLDEDPAQAANLKIAVFGDMAPEEIVRRTGVDAAVLATWESLFYDARKSREAFGWVLVRVINPELAAGNVNLACKLKFVAAVGPAGAAAVLDLGSRAPLSAGNSCSRGNWR